MHDLEFTCHGIMVEHGQYFANNDVTTTLSFRGWAYGRVREQSCVAFAVILHNTSAEYGLMVDVARWE